MSAQPLAAAAEPAPLAAAAAPGAGSRARQAIAWTAGFQIFRDVLQFGLTLALVRLLPPEAYGQFGFVTTLLGFLTLYSSREFLTYTLQVRDDDRTWYQDHFTAGAVIQTGLFLLTNAVAVGLRFLPDFAPASPLVHAMSVLFLLDLASDLRIKMLERTLDWRRLRVLHGIALIAGALLALVLAFSGAGAYALLLPSLLVPLPFIYDLLVRARWRPTWQWSWARYRDAWRYGSQRILAVSFVSAAGLLESSWLTTAAGFAALGVFGRAIGLAQLLCGRVAGLFAQATFPVLTRIEPRTDAYRRASAMYLRSILWVVVPSALLSALLATPIVHLLYGPVWTEIIPLLPWAMAGGATMAAVHTAYTLLLASGGQKHCLRVDIWRLAGTVLVLTAALPFGLRGYLIGLAAVHLVSLVLVIYWLVEVEAIRSRGLIDAFVPPALCGALALLAVMLVRVAIDPASQGIWSPIVQVGSFGLVYVAGLRIVFRTQLRDLVHCLPEHARFVRLLRLQDA